MYLGNSKESYPILPILFDISTAYRRISTLNPQMASQEIMAKNTFAEIKLAGATVAKATVARRAPRFALGLVGALLWSSALSYAPTASAQVNNADLACYLHSEDGTQYDLSELCGGFTAVPASARSQEVVLQTGDVQVTLRWEGDADLDLAVEGPSGNEVSFINPSIPSGGQLDVDANAGCFERMTAPVENIFWPEGGGVTGDYMVTVDLFSGCTTEGPVAFSLDVLTHGEVQNHTGTVSIDQSSARFPFSLADASSSPVIEETTDSLPAVPQN